MSENVFCLRSVFVNQFNENSFRRERIYHSQPGYFFIEILFKTDEYLKAESPFADDTKNFNFGPEKKVGIFDLKIYGYEEKNQLLYVRPFTVKSPRTLIFRCSKFRNFDIFFLQILDQKFRVSFCHYFEQKQKYLIMKINVSMTFLNP